MSRQGGESVFGRDVRLARPAWAYPFGTLGGSGLRAFGLFGVWRGQKGCLTSGLAVWMPLCLAFAISLKMLQNGELTSSGGLLVFMTVAGLLYVRIQRVKGDVGKHGPSPYSDNRLLLT
jgi:hypothetical protein